MEQRRGLLADEVNAACVVNVVDVVPADALGPVFLLQRHKQLGFIFIYHRKGFLLTFSSPDLISAIASMLRNKRVTTHS